MKLPNYNKQEEYEQIATAISLFILAGVLFYTL